MAEYNIQYEKKAKYLINSNKYMVISTSDGMGSAWGSALFYACDEKYDFYFYSNINSRHCTNIAKNPKVSLTIFNHNAIVGTYDGVQIEGTAAMVSDLELPSTIHVYFKKIYPDLPGSDLNNILPDPYRGASNLKFFRVRISNVYLSEINGRIEVIFSKPLNKWV